jgi:O-acetyl-ADP-ribose deacetylase (regulator of RNase III)
LVNDEFRVGKTIIRLVKGDITEMTTDVIVNAANSSLLGGGGVDGAIHSKGGPKILAECRKIRETYYPDGLSTGKAVMTSGGNLGAKKVVHTVGPVWNGGKQSEHELLKQAYLNSLQLAISNGLKTIAFPAISSGAYGYPVKEASRVALKAVKDFLEKEDSLECVVFVLFSEANLRIYTDVALEMFR